MKSYDQDTVREILAYIDLLAEGVRLSNEEQATFCKRLGDLIHVRFVQTEREPLGLAPEVTEATSPTPLPLAAAQRPMEEWIDIKQAAVLTGYSDTSLGNMLRTNRIPPGAYKQIGQGGPSGKTHWRFRRSWIGQFRKDTNPIPRTEYQKTDAS